MTHHRPSLSLLVAASIVCALVSACDQHEPVAASDVAIVATVNDVAITELDMTLAAGSTGGHQGEIAAPGEREVLQRIILQELAYQKAIAANLDSDAVYRENLRRVEAQIMAFKRKALAELFYEKELAKRSQVSDAEASAYFDENVGSISTDIHVWQILRRDEGLIEQDRKRLDNGESFETVAASRFEGMPQVSEMPWDIGYLKWEQIPEVWWEAIGKLNPGDTSDVIRGPNNRFWIIKLVDQRQNPNVSYLDVETRVKDVLKSRRIRQFRENLDAELLRGARIEFPE
jgi:EpsD family peptidyl-prolyl cis-trans isomerase